MYIHQINSNPFKSYKCDEGINRKINEYILTKPEILTSFKLAQNGNKKQLPNKDYEFSFNYWMDIARVHEIDSLSEYSIVNVDNEYKVEFADEETKQSYERYVDQIKTDLAAEYDVNENDIVSKTTFKMGDLKEGLIFGENFYYIVLILTFPLTRFIISGLLNIMTFPRFEVKKIISQSAVKI